MRMTSQRKSRFWTEPQEIDHLGWFTVRWEGISIPYNHSRDYIALYLVPDGQTDVAPHDYLDMLDLMSEGGTWPRGMLNFTSIPNVRGSYFLRYFRRGKLRLFMYTFPLARKRDHWGLQICIYCGQVVRKNKLFVMHQAHPF